MNNLINFDDNESVKKAILYIAPTERKMNDLEINMAIASCVKHKLNPFLKECYILPFGSKYSIVINYLTLCNKIRTKYPNLQENWVKEYNVNKTEYVRLELTLDNGKARVVHEVFMNEYKSKIGLWGSKPNTMLQKTCRAGAYRMLDNEFKDLYIPEEIQEIKSQEKVIHNDNIPKTPSKIPQIEQAKEIVINYPQNITYALNVLNGDSLELDMIFDETNHTYTKNGIEYQCVSNFIGKEKLPNYSNIVKAAEEGKLVHQAISDYLLANRDINILDNSELKFNIEKYPNLNKTFFQNALNELAKLGDIEVIGTEFIVCDDDLKVAGTIDLLVKANDSYYLIDFKRSIYFKDKGNIKANINDYNMQLYTYKQLLKKYPDLGINFSRKNFQLKLISFGNYPSTFTIKLSATKTNGEIFYPYDIYKKKWEKLTNISKNDYVEYTGMESDENE